jgi:radical SAM superfamily enzyme YgiQ (UPF0313 family)
MDRFNREILLVERTPKQSAEITVSWAYPSSYNVGMSGLGYQLIWWLLEQEEDIKTYRTFTDISENSWQPSEMTGFTLSWELDFVNILCLLKRASIPLLSRRRQLEDSLVFGGGPVLTANPEPFAEIFDVILLGDAEVTIPNLIKGWREARLLPDRKERLAHLSKFAGLYVPDLYRYQFDDRRGPLLGITRTDSTDGTAEYPCRQAYVAPPDYLAHSVILSPDCSWANMFLLELTRSCPQECRFCLASHLTRPFRMAAIDTVMSKIDWALKYTKRIGILGPSVTEHPGFAELAEKLIKLGDISASISSIRMDTISPLVLAMLSVLGQKSLTIALESGSERLRSLMKKQLSEQEIWQGMDCIAGSGIEQVKFYAMVGLPHETDDDIAETVRLITSIKKRFHHLRIVLGVSSFVPKAQTPFQWCGRDRRCAEKIEYLRKHLCRLGVDLRSDSHNWSDVQAYLSRADRRVTPLLLGLSEGKSNLGAWKRAFRQTNHNCPPADFYIYRDIPKNEFLPWSHIQDAEKQAYLAHQHELALEGM